MSCLESPTVWFVVLYFVASAIAKRLKQQRAAAQSPEASPRTERRVTARRAMASNSAPGLPAPRAPASQPTSEAVQTARVFLPRVPAPANPRAPEPRAAPPEMPEAFREWLASMGLEVEPAPRQEIPDDSPEDVAREEAPEPVDMYEAREGLRESVDMLEEAAGEEVSAESFADGEAQPILPGARAAMREAALATQAGDGAVEHVDREWASYDALVAAAGEVPTEESRDALDLEQVVRWRGARGAPGHALAAPESSAALLRDALLLDAVLTPPRAAWCYASFSRRR